MKMDRRKVCVLTSGGLDSAVLLGDCLQGYREVHPMYVSAGLRWEKAERYWLRRFLKDVKRRGLKPLVEAALPAQALYGKHWSLGAGAVPGARAAWTAVYLPGRNLLLLSLAATYCAQRGIGTIAIGTLEGNPFSDASPDFYGDMEAIFNDLFGPIKVVAPLRHLDKKQVVRRGAG